MDLGLTDVFIKAVHYNLIKFTVSSNMQVLMRSCRSCQSSLARQGFFPCICRDKIATQPWHDSKLSLQSSVLKPSQRNLYPKSTPSYFFKNPNAPCIVVCALQVASFQCKISKLKIFSAEATTPHSCHR